MHYDSRDGKKPKGWIPFESVILELIYQGQVIPLLKNLNMVEDLEVVTQASFNANDLVVMKLFPNDNMVKPKIASRATPKAF